MLKNGAASPWRCRVKDRERGADRYYADPASSNYNTVRRRLRKRIAAKKELIKQLEAQLAEEDTG